MAQEDVVRGEETKAALEEAKKQIETNENDQKNRELVDAARSEMKAVLAGGLRLDQERLGDDEEPDDDPEKDKPKTLEDAFARIRKEMKRQFSSRLNTDEQNQRIALLQQGRRIQETFELFHGEEDEEGRLVSGGRPPFCIRFQSVNSDEESFISQIALRNGQAIRNGTEEIPLYDQNMRMEMMLVFSTISIGGDVLDPISIEDMYSSKVDAKGKELKLTSVVDKLREVNARLGLLRSRLPLGTYSTAIAALGVWVEYQTDLVSPMRIANF